jgi:hypothetical protein
VGIKNYQGPTYFKLGPPLYRYRDVTFFTEDGRVVGFMAVGKTYTTASGVTIGDDLADARDAFRYPQLRCGEAALGDHGHFPACTGEIGWKRYVWFGGDPISNITVGIRPLPWG